MSSRSNYTIGGPVMDRLIIVTAAGGALLLAGCGSGSHPAAAAKAAHSGASSSSGNCQSYYDAWESAGSTHQKKFAAALNNVESVDNQFNNDVSAGNNPTADANTLAGDVGALEGAIGLITTTCRRRASPAWPVITRPRCRPTAITLHTKSLQSAKRTRATPRRRRRTLPPLPPCRGQATPRCKQ